MEGQTGTRARGDAWLVAARVLAGVLGVVQLAGVLFFTVFARDDAVWLGPVIDVPVIGLMVVGMLLKVACSVWPGLSADRRVGIGLAGVVLGVATTLVKIPLYDEPEGVTFLAADTVLAVLLLLARRGVRRRAAPPTTADIAT